MSGGLLDPRARGPRGLLVAALVALAPLAIAEAGPPPQMPDPSRMSGIPRPDPNLTPGTVTVRCLDGGFANPAVGVEVSLEITTETGTEVREATTIDQGRATFTGLDEFFGRSVVAKASVAGQALQSQTFTLAPQAGVALLLVASDGQAPATGPHGDPSAGASDPHGGQGAMPIPGRPFPLAGRPRGTLVVGALDLSQAKSGAGPIEGAPVVLRATAEGLDAPIIEEALTDAEGRATFEGLDARLPEGAQIVVGIELPGEASPQVSDSFTLGDSGYALVFTHGQAGQAGQAGQGQAGAQQASSGAQASPRMDLPPPRVDKSLQPGQVRVIVLDAHDRPVADQGLIVHSSQATGDSSNRVGRTDSQGSAIVEGVPVAEGMLAQVRVVYEGAPYSSTLFGMPDDAGAIVMLRVFRPTGDRTRVRSALQIDVSPRENDFAAVSFNYALFVDGDEAFWAPGGMTIFGPEGTRSFHVLDEAKNWLVHDGEAPFATLDRPLEPGVELRLSFAVGIEHDGTLELEWTTPFPLVDDASMVSIPASLSVTHGVAGAPEVNPHAAHDGGPLEIYKLGYQPFGLRLCDLLAREGRACVLDAWGGNDVAITVEGLPIRDRRWPLIAWTLVGLTALVVAGNVIFRRRVGAREALLARRDALMAELVALDTEAEAQSLPEAERRSRRAKLMHTLDRIYRQLEALERAD